MRGEVPVPQQPVKQPPPKPRTDHRPKLARQKKKTDINQASLRALGQAGQGGTSHRRDQPGDAYRQIGNLARNFSGTGVDSQYIFDQASPVSEFNSLLS